MRIPQWFRDYKDRILDSLPDLQTIETYTTFHDIGKAFCLEIDENGKRHYPNHAEISYQKWIELADDDIPNKNLIGDLIRYDMLFHTEDAETILDKKLPLPILCTLLLSALAAIHANAEAFGGFESDSFKIKIKRIEKRGQKICSQLRTYINKPTSKDII